MLQVDDSNKYISSPITEATISTHSLPVKILSSMTLQVCSCNEVKFGAGCGNDFSTQDLKETKLSDWQPILLKNETEKWQAMGKWTFDNFR